LDGIKIVENERNLIAVKSVRVERTSIKFGLEALALDSSVAASISSRSRISANASP